MATVSEYPVPFTKEYLISQLRELAPNDFASRHILDRVPWLFADRHQYIDWKADLAVGLEVDPFMLIVVGSAGLGFSLSPTKHFSPFGPRSDIDVAVVSQRHFDEAWRWLRGIGFQNLFERDKLVRDMFKWHRRNLVFDGAIATDQLLSNLPYGSQWASALGHASSCEPTTGREIKVRLYRDFESLRAYHVANVRELKLGLVAEETEGAPGALRIMDSDNERTVPGTEEA